MQADVQTICPRFAPSSSRPSTCRASRGFSLLSGWSGWDSGVSSSVAAHGIGSTQEVQAAQIRVPIHRSRRRTFSLELQGSPDSPCFEFAIPGGLTLEGSGGLEAHRRWLRGCSARKPGRMFELHGFSKKCNSRVHHARLKRALKRQQVMYSKLPIQPTIIYYAPTFDTSEYKTL